jgi:hypothetical protein
MLKHFPVRWMIALIAVVVAVSTAVKAADQETGNLKGIVTLDGKPLDKGKVLFHPKDAKPIEVEIKDGSYTAKDVPTGTMPVTVEGEGVPKAFTDAKTSPLQIEVKKGQQEANFDLKKI